MGTPRVLFTVRRMMVAVAVAAGSLWGLGLCWNAVRYRSLARYHAMMWRATIVGVAEAGAVAGPGELAELNRRWAAHFKAMKDKYAYAAAHPWVAVGPAVPCPVPLSGRGRLVTVNFPD